MSGNMQRWESTGRIPSKATSSQHTTVQSKFSRNKHRWMSDDWLPADDTSSQYSAANSDISVDDGIRSPDVCQRLRSLFNEKLYTDVKFVISCGIKPKPTLLAHKAILAIGSDKFKEMLFEKNGEPSAYEIQINNISLDAFRNVVEYLYTDDVFFDSDQSVMETLFAASKFEVQALVNKCESYIESTEINEGNVCTKLKLSINNNLLSLKSRCTEFIQDYTSSVLRSADFKAASMSIVRSICKMEKLNLRSELELFEGVIRWVEAQPEAKINKAVILEPFLKHIRFLALSCEEFNQLVQKFPYVFKSPEATNILYFLANPSRQAHNLPHWCNKGTNRCTYLLAPPRRQERHFQRNHNFSIPLRSCKVNQFMSSLICVLQLKCSRGKWSVKALKLSFDEPICEFSRIGDLTISVCVEPSNYNFEERIKIENSKDVVVEFSKKLLIRPGLTVNIRAEAKEIRKYKFLQFDENSLFAGDSPFRCSLVSEPKDNRLFFINEVIYHDAPEMNRGYQLRPNYRYRR